MKELVAKYVPFCALTVKTDFEIKRDLSHDVSGSSRIISRIYAVPIVNHKVHYVFLYASQAKYLANLIESLFHESLGTVRFSVI